ncbi:MAG: AmmeMemoRadiSam system protein A [Candidatus Bipolaricaulaceae bacterium]
MGSAGDPYVRLARLAVETYVRSGEVVSPPPNLPEDLTQGRAGAFVSLKRDGELRGCIGTIAPTAPTLAQEIIQNAIRAASEDPRFPPVSVGELAQLSVTVDVLSPAQPCSPADLDPRKYGVIVESGWHRGLLLPDLPGVDSAEEQLRIAKLKAGLPADHPCRLLRFTVERHQE